MLDSDPSGYIIRFFWVLYRLRKKGTFIPMSVKSLYLRNAWSYRVEIQSIYSDLQPHDFLTKTYFYIYF